MTNVHLVVGEDLGGEQRARLTQVTKAYIAAASVLDAVAIAALMAEDAIYESQWTSQPIRGRVEIEAYLTAKYETIRRNPNASPKIVLGHVDLPAGRDHPVALVSQFGKWRAFVALAIDDDSHIVRHDILGLVPPVATVRLAERDGQ